MMETLPSVYPAQPAWASICRLLSKNPLGGVGLSLEVNDGQTGNPFDRVRETRRRLARALLASPDRNDLVGEEAAPLLELFEVVGGLMEAGAVPRQAVWEACGQFIQFYWAALGEHVQWATSNRRSSDGIRAFERLHTAMEACGRTATGRADLRAFLQNELQIPIRPFVPDDFDGVMEVEACSFEPGKAYSRSLMEECYRDYPDGFFVSEWMGQVVGYIVFYCEGRVGRLDSLAVHADSRRLGIGVRLTDYALRSMRARGAVECLLQVSVDNPSAIAHYNKLGFWTERTLKGFYADSTDAFEMRAPLIRQ